MNDQNTFLQRLDAIGDSMVQRLNELGDYLYSAFAEQVDNLMSGLIGKIGGMLEKGQDAVSNAFSAGKEKISASLTPSASPNKAPSQERPAPQPSLDAPSKKEAPDMQGLLEKSGLGGMQAFHCEEMVPGETAQAGCMSAGMARQNAIMQAEAAQQMQVS
jgi:hypothetical protein